MDPRLRLADLVPALSDPSASFGAWSARKGAGTPEDPIELPHYIGSPLEEAFRAAAAAWMEPGFDWPAWRNSAEGAFYFANSDNVARADAAILAHMITTLIRADRFSDGTLAGAYASGLLLAIARRAEALLRT